MNACGLLSSQQISRSASLNELELQAMVLDAIPWNECLSQQDVSSSACTQLRAGSSRLGVPLPNWNLSREGKPG